MIRPLRRGLKGDSVKRSNESLTPTVTSPLYWERCVCARSAPQSCPTLCDPMDCSPPSGSSVHGISQARILEWVDMSFSRGSSRPRGQTQVFCIGRWVPYHLGHQGSPWYCLKELKICNICSVQFSSVTQSCLTLCDPMNCSTPGLPVHHQLPEFTQTHVHQVGDAIQPSHPLSSPSPLAPNPSQHQSLFQ